MKYNMVKHIYETPVALENTLRQALPTIVGICAKTRESKLDMIIITGCGASYHDALSAKYSFEKLLNIPVLAWPASELGLYPKDFFAGKRLLIAISRSGEKSDIMMAVRKAKQSSAQVIAVTATPDSLLAVESGQVVLTHEGPEYCQPKTKSFVSVLGILNLIAINLLREPEERRRLTDELLKMPDVIGQTIRDTELQMKLIASEITKLQNIYVTGSQANLGAVFEGALKLKETSFIHAEPFPVGEVAQGPILLLNKKWAYISLIARQDREIAVKIMQAGYRMGAKTIAVSENVDGLKPISDYTVKIPVVPNELFLPMAYIIPIQFLAYYLAMEKGLNPDNPEGFDTVLELILEPGRAEPEMRKTE